MTDARPTLAPGRVIGGKYRLERLLGEGGMGSVYGAENLMLRAPVAIKVLRPELSHLPDILNRFTQEAQAAAQVRHANIVSVLDFGRDDDTGSLFLVQEFLVGVDLKHRLRGQGAMAPREAIELLLPLMRALSYAHAKGVVHRDLKPDNIFLCDGPGGVEPKLIDFGIAKVFDAEGRSVQKTRTAQTLGTPLYMSPEQARGDATVDHRTDIWSLGVVLYQMLTLRHPYEGESANEIIGRILFQAPTPIEVWRPELPPDIVALVHGAIQPDRTLRYPTMDAFAHAARACAVMEAPAPLAMQSTQLQPAPGMNEVTHYWTMLSDTGTAIALAVGAVLLFRLWLGRWPEAVTVLPADAGEGMPATVLASSFLGAISRLTLDAGDAGLVLAQLATSDALAHPQGSAVRLRLRPDAVLVTPVD